MGNTNILFHTFWCGRKSNPAGKKKLANLSGLMWKKRPFHSFSIGNICIGAVK